MQSAFVLSIAFLALACSSSGKEPRSAQAREGDTPRAAPAPAGAPAWQGARETRSALGTYLVRWRTTLDPVVEGETFAIEAWVFDAAAPEHALADVELDVDAGMPQHGHGMAAYARHSRRDDGGWRAEGLRFHMGGRWELTFDIARGARTERAQVGIELE